MTIDDQQRQIAERLGVSNEFDPATEARRRRQFLADYTRATSSRALVLGISGGVDSLTAGLLAQQAAADLRAHGYQAHVIAVRLPYGRQADEDDAQRSLQVIAPDRVVTVDIKPAADAMLDAITRDGADLMVQSRLDFHLGNIKARQRMIAQYALAGTTRGLVIGTDHAAEAVMGFFTKFGDGAADIVPLAGLTKRRVRAIATHLGAPDDLVFKIPTADLETDAPLRPDEDVYGVTYSEIDDFLEGKPVSEAAFQTILSTYRASEHKRQLPHSPDLL
ncbi:NAD+ synthase [Rhizobium sp. BK650]|uniref:ammonia-dependent NAD(+) synthetase n=1 Tax=Rhizobium sp. BK650 TaxID=2586990 RepID=UPI0016124DE2|nr:ammonia-dependent NAD(+) synthetase [Rhizobium sp. BK650]MBB3660783.1 NAD+ synthase [Rhizobium sp. BK650]